MHVTSAIHNTAWNVVYGHAMLSNTSELVHLSLGILVHWESTYSGDTKTGHSKSRIIRKLDVFDVRFSNGWHASLDRFIVKNIFAYKTV